MNRKYVAYLLTSVLVLVALVGLAWAATVEDELKKLETDRAAATVKGDIATLAKQTSDDYTVINLRGQVIDKAQVLDMFKTGKTKFESNELSDLKVRVYGNVALVIGKANVKGTLAGQAFNGQIIFTRVYVKKGGSWQSVAFQQTQVANP